MNSNWYSVRMRASCAGRHLSGAERIGRARDIAELTSQLTERAFVHVGGPPDSVNCTVEKLDTAEILSVAFPDVRTWQVTDCSAGRLLAARLLTEAGISGQAVNFSLQALASGPAPGGTAMRGAMIVDAGSGQRLEPDAARGVRVSHMDVAPKERPTIEEQLKQAGLGHSRVLEALVLAAKVLQAPGLLAELCWSDDPDYLTGYVATPGKGYQRISCLKESGCFAGGRVFFVDSHAWSLDAFIEFLEKKPVLMRGCPAIHPFESWSS